MEKEGACLCTGYQGAAPNGLWQQWLANSRDKQLGGNYGDEKEQKGLRHLNVCLRGSLDLFQSMSASRPPVLLFAHSVCSDCCWPCLSPRISAVSHGGFWNDAWPALSGRWFSWHLAWNYSATVSWWGKLFKDQGESFNPLFLHMRAFSSTWHMWQSGVKMCAVIFNGISFKKEVTLEAL